VMDLIAPLLANQQTGHFSADFELACLQGSPFQTLRQHVAFIDG